MSKEDILRAKYDLGTGEDCTKLRALELDFIVEKANSQLSAEMLRGMLLLINERDRWEREYLALCKQANKE